MHEGVAASQSVSVCILYVCVCVCVFKLSDLISMAQSATTCEPFENPSKPRCVNQKDCRL